MSTTRNSGNSGKRVKWAAGYFLCILGGMSVVISVVLVAVWNAVPTLTFIAGLFLLFGWSSLLVGWAMSRKPSNP